MLPFFCLKTTKGGKVAEVVILGAGITGLFAAYFLEQVNFHNYEIFEKENIAGGLLRSFHLNGFTFDISGHWLHLNNPTSSAIINEIIKLEDLRLINRNAAIFYKEHLAKYPFQINLAGLPPTIIYECIEGYISRNRYKNKIQNFENWIYAKFGKGLARHFFIPLNKKLHTTSLKNLTTHWTMKYVPKTTLKEMIYGALGVSSQKIGYNSSFLYPSQNGIQVIIDNLQKKIHKKIKTCHEAKKINLKNKTIYFTNGTNVKYERIINTIPLKKFLSILEEPANENLNVLAKYLKHNSVINFNLGFKKKMPYDYHWIYFPEKIYSFYRLGFWSNISPTLAPQNKSSLYGEIPIPPTFTKTKIEKLTERAIQQTLNFIKMSPNDVVIKKNLLIKYAYVRYDKWREKNIKKILKKLQEINICSGGRYGEWKYSSMEDAIWDAKILVEKTLAHKFKIIPAQKYKTKTKSSSCPKISFGIEDHQIKTKKGATVK